MRVLVAVMALTGTVARAQLPFGDDFESGNLSKWLVQDNPGVTIEASTLAAHRGTYGVRVVDTETVVEDTSAARVSKRINSTSQNLYQRVWFRVPSRNAAGGTLFFYADWEIAGSSWANAAGCNFDFEGKIFCGQQDPDNAQNINFKLGDAGWSVVDGGWSLFEALTAGRGTDAGWTVFAIDGRIAVRYFGLHANAQSFPSVEIGEVYNYDPGFMTVLDFDDPRYDVRPMASRVNARVADTLHAGECGAIVLFLTATMPDVDGGTASSVAAPYSVEFVVEGASVFSDDACSVAGSPVLDGGATEVRAFVRPATADPINVTVKHVGGDLLPSSTSFTVLPATAQPDGGGVDGGSSSSDGGVDDRSYYALQCGVGGAVPMMWIALLALAARRRRSATSSRTS
ncbi:MAG: hypothetical protein QM817_03515 [Archangium sp.]